MTPDRIEYLKAGGPTLINFDEEWDELCNLALRATDPCEWRCDTVDDCWDTSCGNMFTLAEGTPDKNMMEFCPYCGGPLVQEDQT